MVLTHFNRIFKLIEMGGKTLGCTDLKVGRPRRGFQGVVKK
jgi:hypothetical protein